MVGGSTHRDGVGLRQPLETSTNVWNLPQGELLLSPTTAHVTDNDQSSMDAHTKSELDTFLALQTGIEISQGSKNSQTSPYCSLRIIFMRLGIAKVHEESIT